MSVSEYPKFYQKFPAAEYRNTALQIFGFAPSEISGIYPYRYLQYNKRVSKALFNILQLNGGLSINFRNNRRICMKLDGWEL